MHRAKRCFEKGYNFLTVINIRDSTKEPYLPKSAGLKKGKRPNGFPLSVKPIASKETKILIKLLDRLSEPYVKHDHGPFVVLHGLVWTLLQNEDLQS